MITGKNDHPGYSCERTQWVLITGVGPLNCWPDCVLKRMTSDSMKQSFRHSKPLSKVPAKSPKAIRNFTLDSACRLPSSYDFYPPFISIRTIFKKFARIANTRGQLKAQLLEALMR